MRKILALGIALIALLLCTGGGCTTVQRSDGWHPQSEDELRNLIGNTVLQAIDIYQQYLETLRLQKATPFLGPQPQPQKKDNP